MPYQKSTRKEKYDICRLSDETLSIIHEMLNIMVERIQNGNRDMDFSYSRGDLHYFGTGKQLKISKLGDTLYSSLRDVLIFVIEEMAKERENELKYQVPKHTSFVGSIIKNVAIDVIAQNPVHKEFLDSLCHMKGKYNLDITSNRFKMLYRDTVLKLAERGYLFDDDPELLQIQHESKGLPLIPGNLPAPVTLEALTVRPDDTIHFSQSGLFAPIQVQGSENTSIEDYDVANDVEGVKSNCRNRIVFPFLRRLFETQKAAAVTLRRVQEVMAGSEPDSEVKAAFNKKYQEFTQGSQIPLERPLDELQDRLQDRLQDQCMMMAINSIRGQFEKPAVDKLQKSLREGRTSTGKTRKRYVKVSSGKKAKAVESAMEYSVPWQPDAAQGDMFAPLN